MKKDLFRWLFTVVVLFSILLIYSCAKGPSDIGGPSDIPVMSTGGNFPYEKGEGFMGEGGQEESPGMRSHKEEFDRRPYTPVWDDLYIPGAEGDYQIVPLPDESEGEYRRIPLPDEEGEYRRIPLPDESEGEYRRIPLPDEEGEYRRIPLPDEEGEYRRIPLPDESEGEYRRVPLPDEEGEYRRVPLPDEEGKSEQVPIPDEEDLFDKVKVRRQNLRAYLDPASDIYKDADGIAESHYVGSLNLRLRDLPSIGEDEMFFCIFEDLQTGVMLEVGSFTVPCESAERRYDDESDGTEGRPEQGDPRWRDWAPGRESGTSGEWYEVVLRWDEDPAARIVWDNLYISIESVDELKPERVVLSGVLIQMDDSSDPSYE